MLHFEFLEKGQGKVLYEFIFEYAKLRTIEIY